MGIGKHWVSKWAKNAPNSCKPVRNSLRVNHASLSRKGKGRCLDPRESAERVPMSGQASNNGRCGLSKSCMRRSGPSSCSTKPQGSEPKKSMSPSAPCPAEPMRSNATGWLACSRQGSKVEREKRRMRCPRRCANSSLTCTLNTRVCRGARLLRFVTFATGDAPLTIA